MTYAFRKAVREDTPLIIGIAGPTKSGKTFSAHRVAQGLARGGVVAMINAEGKRGHQYADRFDYVATDIHAPFSTKSYIEALREVKKIKPAVLIIDSLSHMHDGPGGMLEEHDTLMEQMAKGKTGKEREAYTWAAWARVKKPENEFVYMMQDLDIPIIACFRAKEKLKIVRGKDPIDLGYQPISSERVAFETIFTLMLPPHSKGVPDLAQSDMREPFDEMVPTDRALDEALGEQLAAWAKGHKGPAPTKAAGSATTGEGGGSSSPSSSTGAGPARITKAQDDEIRKLLKERGVAVARFLETAQTERLEYLLAADFQRAVNWIARQPVVDLETRTLRAIDTAKDQDEAAVVLDAVREETFYTKASEAFTNRWVKPPPEEGHL